MDALEYAVRPLGELRRYPCRPHRPRRPRKAALIDPHGTRCFGYGPDNPVGLALRVFRVDDEVLTDFVFDDQHAGAHGVAYGGAVASSCDATTEGH